MPTTTISKTEFNHYLKVATSAAITFAKRFVTNRMSPSVSYDARYGKSCDGEENGFTLYPEDGGVLERGLTQAQVVECLYREGRVPVWIDISVIGSNRFGTRIQLLCAGRFFNQIENLYYTKQNIHPFGIKSPIHLPWLEEGERYYLLYENGWLEGPLGRLRWWWYRTLQSVKWR